jgi:hypothetical protein
VPTTVDEALRLAVKLAVDGGNYQCAAEVLNILRRVRLRRPTDGAPVVGDDA